MAWSGGSFTRVHDWTTDAGSAINIEASRMDAEDDNFATGIDSCIHKGGQNAATADLPMGGNRHTGVDNAAARTDYASAADVQDQDLIYAVDSGAADAYVITLPVSLGALEEGQRVVFRSSATNTGASTIAVNGLAATAIQTPDGNALTAGMVVTGGYYEVTYDANGSRFVLTSPHSFQPVITAGTGMTGGGTLPASMTLNVIGGTGITANANEITTTDSEIVHDNLSGFVANEHIDHTGVTLTAGNGLTGGGTIAANRSFAVGAGTGITASADEVAVSAQLQDLHNVGVVDAADKMLVSSAAGTWTYETGAQVLTTIGGQPVDSDLTAIAALSTQTYGRSLLTTANEAALKTLINLEIGTDVQAYDAQLTTWAGVSPSANGQSLVAAANYAAMKVLLDLEIGTDVQAHDTHLDDLAALSPAEGDGAFMVSTGVGTWQYETGATARTSLGLGTGDSPQFTGINVGAASDTTITRDAAGQIAVEGDAVFSHDSGTYTSAKIFFSNTTEPTTQGSDGDIFLVY